LIKDNREKDADPDAVQNGHGDSPENAGNSSDASNRTIRSTFWVTATFYGLIALEFLYMFSPFAVYVYSVYGPGLQMLKFSGTTSWLIGFFMPHIVYDTNSLLITWHEHIGAVLLAGGLFSFTAGAFQVYRNKLLKRGAVISGVYRHVRHPQYLALMISGFGMVLLWPRYLVLAGFVTICFAYYLLARAEERICLRKFPGYAGYMEKTAMFFPVRLFRLKVLLRGLVSRWMQKERTPRELRRLSHGSIKFAAGLAIYVVMLLVALILARWVHHHSVNSVYAHATDREVYISIGRMPSGELEVLALLAGNDKDLGKLLQEFDQPENRFINYVMPVDLYISEVPMHVPEDVTPGHGSPHRLDQRHFKIIFTMAHFGPGQTAEGRGILLRALHKSPVAEVWINRETGEVKRVLEPPASIYYEGIPVPVF
jgi:protein-S-isoprenylcysteine O-methyltransferase Ste14